MIKITSMVLFLVLSFSTPLRAVGDESWSGSVTLPDRSVHNVSYDVAHENGKLTKIKLIIEDSHYDMSDVEISDDESTIVVSWKPGDTVICSLNQNDDDVYVGKCVDENGENSGELMMKPLPKDDNELDDEDREL